MSQYNHTKQVGGDWVWQLSAPVIDGVAEDMSAEGYAEALVITDSDNSTTAAFTVNQTATANGSVIAVAAGGASGTLTVKKEDLVALGPGEYSYYDAFTASDGVDRVRLYGTVTLEA